MKKAFVIGDPIAHSKSPVIHRHWLARHGIEGFYDAIHVVAAELPAFIARLRDGEFAGGNVTIPHKHAVMDLCDAIDPLASRIGAVNTLVRRPDGGIEGSNSDYIGFLANLDQEAPGWDAGRGAAMVIGAGGAARGIVAALVSRGVGEILVLNRTPERARDLAAAFGPTVAGHGLDDYQALAPRVGLLVNTSSVGMGGTRFEGMPLDRLAADAVVNDIVYAPLETPLLAEARALGLRPVDGLGMLLHQAVPGFAAWFGVSPSVDADLRRAVLETMGR